MNDFGDSNAETLKFIKQLQQQMTTIGNLPPSNPSRPRKNRVIHKRANVSKFCWSHGSCAWTGCDCIIKIQGYKYTAMFGNKMSGSMYYCQASSVNPYILHQHDELILMNNQIN